jgi:hypothetical protein
MQPVNGVGGIMRFGTVVTIAACVLLSACASKPQDIELIAAPAHTYASYDCEQMLVEARNLVEEATSSYRAQVRRNRADKQTMIVGFFVTWPVTMLVEGDGLEAEKIGILKGRMQALENASTKLDQPGCKITFTNV